MIFHLHYAFRKPRAGFFNTEIRCSSSVIFSLASVFVSGYHVTDGNLRSFNNEIEASSILGQTVRIVVYASLRTVSRCYIVPMSIALQHSPFLCG